jgi:DNA-binding NarL/FixJ family response regulator
MPEGIVRAAIERQQAAADTVSAIASRTETLQSLRVVGSPSNRDLHRGLPASNRAIRVMIVDDHKLVREGLRGLLRSAPGIEVVGEASNGGEAVAAIAQGCPDVVVMDLDVPGGDGATLTRKIATLANPPRILILTMRAEDERLIAPLKDGASGFLSKDTDQREFVEAIRVVASGELFVPPTVAQLLAANAMPHVHHPSPLDEAREKLALLSPRERSVLRLVAEGYSGVEIARLLGITPKTVDTYKNRIGQKLRFTHRTDYVRFALRLGLLEA